MDDTFSEETQNRKLQYLRFPSVLQHRKLLTTVLFISFFRKMNNKNFKQNLPIFLTFADHNVKKQKQPPEVFCKKRCSLLKKSLWHRCFPVNFAKFLRIHFLQNTSGRLFLKKLNSFMKTINFHRIGFLGVDLENSVKDKLKAFDNLRNKHQKCMK